jgi:hypothetical protein
MANFKKFLIPVSVALAGLTAGNAQAIVDPTAPAPESPSDQTVSKLAAPPREGASRVVFATGGELHALILARNNQGVMLSDHESHVSHASHGSHRSHTSGY